MPSKKIAQRIKLIRERFGLSQKSFAERLSVGQTTVAHWELTGKVPKRMLGLITHKFGISLEWLQSGKEPMRAGTDRALRMLSERVLS